MTCKWSLRMCGDLEEEEAAEATAYAAFLVAAQAAIHDAVDHRGGARERLGAQSGPPSDHDLYAYMDGLFADVLRACIKDGGRIQEASRYRLLSAQAVVLARLAGFVAGRLARDQDPLRSTIEALMAGYAEESGHGHDHVHG
jgi:hypothetical protein